MSNNPWIDPDPQPGDFDADLITAGPPCVDRHQGHAGATVRIVVSVEGEDVKRLERIAAARGTDPGEVVAELLREADRSVA